MDALVTLSSKGQLVIPARMRQLLGLRTDDHLVMTLEPDSLRLVPQGHGKTASVHAQIGCAGYEGEAIPLERMDPALYAAKGQP
jgi:AbrB family looped-hinge helix DNA binding protein